MYSFPPLPSKIFRAPLPPAALAGADPDLVHGGWLVILAGIKAHATPKRREVAAADPHDANGVGCWVVGSGD